MGILHSIEEGCYKTPKDFIYDSTDSEITLEEISGTFRKRDDAKNFFDEILMVCHDLTICKIKKSDISADMKGAFNVKPEIINSINSLLENSKVPIKSKMKESLTSLGTGSFLNVNPNVDSISGVDKDPEVMHNFQRYSREPPEKDQNMKSCSSPQSRKYCRNSRNISDAHVSCRNQGSLDIEKSKGITPQKDYRKCVVGGEDHPPLIPSPPPPPIQSGSSRIRNSFNYTGERKFHLPSTSPSPIPPPPPYNQMYSFKHHQFPYEEPTDSTSYSRATSCCSRKCSGYDQCLRHRLCKCQCLCDSEHYYDDQLSCSESSDFMNLAYQRTGDYPELVDELENTLSQRNRIRVQKTRQQFEILSRQNKNLEKPIFDDEASLHNHTHHTTHTQKRTNECCKCPCCTERAERTAGGTSSRNKRVPHSGYVEKLARYMDPNSEKNRNGTWQMDSRKGEWVKVLPRQNQYDFENHYPPLPPRPLSAHVYDERANNRREREYSPQPHPPPKMDQHCSCNKCSRRSRS